MAKVAVVAIIIIRQRSFRGVIAFWLAENRTIYFRHCVCGVDPGLRQDRLNVLINTTYFELLLRVVHYRLLTENFKKGSSDFPSL